MFYIYRDMSGIYHFLINLGGGMVWWYMKVVDEIFDSWRPQDFDFFDLSHELAHNRTTTSIRTNDINRTTHMLQQELRQCDARAHDAPAKHWATVLSRHNAKIAAVDQCWWDHGP